MDPEQARLKDEFALEDLLYVFRSGERDPEPGEGCSVVEATIALACAQPDPGLSTQAKREMGRLWEAIDRAPYKLLFNPTTTYVRIWRAVKVMRSVDSTLRSVSRELEGRSRGVPVHGHRLVLHLVFATLPLNRIDDPAFDWDSALGDLERLARGTVVRVVAAVEEKYPTGYLASLFKNAKKCAELATTVKAEMTP